MMTNKKYQITKEECQKKIDQSKYKYCSRCCTKLTPVGTYDNAGNPTYWIHCGNCSRFEHGTTKEIYKIAKKLSESHTFFNYKDNEKRRISIMCSIVDDCIKLLSESVKDSVRNK